MIRPRWASLTPSCRRDVAEVFEVRGRVEQERRRDPEVLDRRRAGDRTCRARDVVGHRVERDGGRQLVGLDQRREQSLLRRDRRGGRHAEPEGEDDYDPGSSEARPGEDGERRGEDRSRRLRGEQEPLAVEAVGCASGPGREQQHRRELAEVEEAEQECVSR